MSIFNNFKVRTRLLGGFGLLLVLMLVLTAVGITRMTHIRQNMQDIVNNNYATIGQVNAMRDAVRYQAIALRDIVLQHDFGFLKQETKRMKEARAKYQAAASKLDASVTAANGKAILARIKSSEEQVSALSDQILEFALNENVAAADQAVRDKLRPTQIELITALDDMLGYLDQVAQSSAMEVEQVYKSTVLVMAVIGAIAVVLGILVAVAITGGITGPLSEAVNLAKRIAAGDLTERVNVKGKDEMAWLLESLNEMATNLERIIRGVKDTADTVAQSSVQLADSTKDVTTRAKAQSERLIMMSAAMEEITVSIAEISNGAKGVLEASTTTHGIAQEGNNSMARSSDASQRIVKTVSSSSEAINGLNATVKKITDITTAINEIAGQTNLLALNAAIEAARAGDQGRGFAVVADEVRTLAQRTAGSTADISDMVGSIKDKTAVAVELMEKARQEVEEGSQGIRSIEEILRHIMQSAAQVTELANHIANATREQSTTADDTAKHMEEISNIAEQNAGSIERVGSSIHQMTHAAEELQRLVGQFRFAG